MTADMAKTMASEVQSVNQTLVPRAFLASGRPCQQPEGPSLLPHLLAKQLDGNRRGDMFFQEVAPGYPVSLCDVGIGRELLSEVTDG